MASSRFSWHRVTFWGILGVIVVLLGFSWYGRDERHRYGAPIVTIFEADGRRQVQLYVYRRLGWQDPPREGQVLYGSPAPSSVHAH